MTVPAGWSIAPDHADSIEVIKKYPWSTHLMVVSNGAQFATTAWGRAGNRHKWHPSRGKPNALGKRGNTYSAKKEFLYKVNACSRRILIVQNSGNPKPAPKPVAKSNTVTYKGKVYRALDNANPTSRSTGCQSKYMTVPAGWSIAPDHADSIEVIKKYPWSTHLMVVSNGAQFATTAWGTAGNRHKWHPSRGKPNALGQSGNTYKVNACSRRIL